MESLHGVLQGESVDGWIVVGMTAASCMVGVLWLLFRSDGNKHEVQQKIQRAQSRSRESLQRAEQEVIHYKKMHPATDSTKISSLSLSELTKELQDGRLTPEEVYYTYMEKTLTLNRKVNCCTEILLESFEQLKTVEASRDGLLYGVPISIKDNISYKNHDTSCGLANYLDKPAEKDSVLVEVLKKQGAIPFVKTNIPQAMISYDCGNPIYGETVNPLDPKRTPGGSSGGEGALIGGGGSLLGIGSDIGGSIRVPAAFCGVCGFKPTAGRLSLKGVISVLKGQKSVMATVGPMAQDVDSLARFMQAVLCDHMFNLDPTVPPMPFDMQTYESSKPLRIGYMESDGFTQSTPSMVRCLRETKALLEKAGHTLVPYQAFNSEYVNLELILKGLVSDGCVTVLEKVSGGPLEPVFAQQIFPYRFPTWFKKTLSFLLKPLSGRTSALLNGLSGVGSVANLWKHHTDVETYITETVELWKKINIDVLLCPVVGPAYHRNVSAQISTTTSSSILYNLLNFPAGVVPVSTVTAEDEEELKMYQGFYDDRFDKLFKEAVSGGEGLPLAVQCVALPWQEELCLRFMKEVETVVKESRK